LLLSESKIICTTISTKRRTPGIRCCAAPQKRETCGTKKQKMEQAEQKIKNGTRGTKKSEMEQAAQAV
jgi:hypothetical protein